MTGSSHQRVGSSVEDSDQAAALAAARRGDQAAFGALVERYRRPLQVHCYRMLGSFDDAEDMVQETLLRAWRARASFEGRSSFRTWLYRIATNICLNTLERTPRRVMPPQVAPPAHDSQPTAAWAPEIPWLQPIPDDLLELAGPRDREPDAEVTSKETIELVYLAALQHLPPRQRTVLILRDALGWPARDAADLLDMSLASVNSALQRARSTMRSQLPPGRLDWGPAENSTEGERALLHRFMDAFERADVGALSSMLREDALQTMPPALLWFEGRAAIVAHYAFLLGPDSPGDFRLLASAANRQPAYAAYLRARGDSAFRLSGINLLRVEGGEIAEITS
ncbi:MAG: RNA polymerase subunit sigma-70, partial [Candidatus Dormibacteraeota bacterium]|nr:RNA polymerase subunit sigma-70 [Candidatus Dormibacteraeota bacterium]